MPFLYFATPRSRRKAPAAGPHPLMAAAILQALLAALAPAELPAQPVISITPRSVARGRSASQPFSLRIDTTTILVPVTVTDATDHSVMDLSRESFRIFEDNVEQKISSLHREEGPVSVGFIFDISGSMKNRMAPSIKAIDQFLKNMTSGDEFFLVPFNDAPRLTIDFTQSADDILSGLSFAQPQGWTALHDAIYLGIEHMKSARNHRRALLVLTDGGDNNSRYTEREVRNAIREADLRVYSIGLFERARLLDQMAADSGGSAFYVHKLDELPQTVDRLSQEFRNQYVLGYSSKNQQRDGKYRKVRVELLETIGRIPFNVSWRRGYYAPPE
jgi:Ca-activated chloride channel family protein